VNVGWAAEEGARAEATERVEGLRVRMLRALEILHAMRALFEVKPGVSRSEFSRFVRSALGRLPELQALEWIPKVKASEREQYESAARRDGLETFCFREISASGQLVDAAPREAYLPVFYVEPSLTNFPVLGLDLLPDPCRSAALHRASATGEPTATSPLQLAQMSHQPTGFLVVLVVREPASGDTLGYCLAVFRVDRVVEEVFAPLISRGVEVAITDLGDGEHTIYPFGHCGTCDHAPWSFQEEMQIAGRCWKLDFRPTGQFQDEDPEWIRRSAEILRRNNRLLEEKVRQRTLELEVRNRELSAEIFRRREAEEGLQHVGNKLSVLSENEARQWGGISLIGRGKRFEKVLNEMEKLQQFPATNILITGESGTGKELVARAIHLGSPNAKEPFVPVSCSTLNTEDGESQLFGLIEENGTLQKGYFSRANQGTLFLDEVADLSPRIQSQLLRVLEDGVLYPTGASTGRLVQLRIIASTNAELPDRVAKGSFRQDLYYRLMQFHIRVPPLRERIEDVPLLAKYFVSHFSRELNRREPELRPDAIRKLTLHPYRGNVRELKNTIERAIIYAGDNEIRAGHIVFAPQAALGLETLGSESSRSKLASDCFEEFPFNLAEAEERLIQRALVAANGNVSEASRLLGVNRARIYRRKNTSAA
jgi:DNA-binding NtrC family response regulator/CHASE1-domain containing sensor protein